MFHLPHNKVLILFQKMFLPEKIQMKLPCIKLNKYFYAVNKEIIHFPILINLERI